MGSGSAGKRIVALGALLAALALRPTPAPVRGEDFDWRNAGSLNFVTPVRNQGSAGTCWAFSTTAALEAKYKLSRNDPVFSPDASEQNLVCAGASNGMGNATSGYEYLAMNYFTSTGVVTEAELPYTAQNTSPNWPLQPGSQARVFKSTSNWNYVRWGTTSIKSELKIYGPLVTSMAVDNEWYPPGTYRVPHSVCIVGYHDATEGDDAEVQTAGGYWIVKNSWGPGWNGDGYGKILYGNVERHRSVHAIDGAVYFTGAMATAAWQGGGGTWSGGSSNGWTSGGNAYSWENKETAAIFGASGPSNPITINGTAIAHGLTFASGAVGYAFSGGALTVTAGGITATESVIINSPVTIGAPQTWTVAPGKVLAVSGDVHAVVSDLTVAGAGDVVLSGTVDDGGVINSCGATGGSLVMSGSGTLTLSGANRYTGQTAIQAGTVSISDAAGLGTAATPIVLGGSVTQGWLSYTGSSAAFTRDATINAGGGGISVAAGGQTLTWSGSITGSAGAHGTLTVGGAGNTAIPGVIDENVGGLTKTGGGTLILGGLNSYAGKTTVKAGVLEFSSLADADSDAIPSALGSPVNEADGTIEMGDGLTSGTLRYVGTDPGGHASDRVINLRTAARIEAAGTGPLALTASAHAVTGTGMALTLAGSGHGSISGIDTGAGGSLTKQGSGTWALAASNSYTGSTTVEAGTLRLLSAGNGNISSSSSILVGDTPAHADAVLDVSEVVGPGGFQIRGNQTLAGYGSVSGGPVTILSGGLYAPGVSVEGLRTGSLTFSPDSGAKFVLGAPGTSHSSPGLSSRGAVTGDLLLNGELILVADQGTHGPGVVGPGSYKLFGYTGSLSGTFTTIAEPVAEATLHAKVADDGPMNPSVYVDVYRLASGAPVISPLDLGSMHVGFSLPIMLSIENVAPGDGYSEGLNASFGSPSPGISATGSVSNLSGGSTDNTHMVLSVNASAAGPMSGTVAVIFASNGTVSNHPDTALGSQTISVHATVFRPAVPGTLARQPIHLGNVHVGGTAEQALTLQNTSPADGYSEGLDARFDAPEGGITASGFVTNLPPSGADSTHLVVGLSTVTPGAKNGAVSVALTSNGTLSGLPNTPLAAQWITVHGNVYSGQGVWNTDGGGDWGLFAKWTDVGGVPGIDGPLSAKDTATFGDVLTSGSATVSLNGISPRVSGMTFTNANCSYLIAEGSGGMLQLANDASPSEVLITGGHHQIDAPLTLDSHLSIRAAVDSSLTVSGAISGPGRSLAKDGAGSLVLSGANRYTGGTVVSDGLLEVALPDGLPPGGALTISNSASVVLSSGLTAGDRGGAPAAVPEPSAVVLLAVLVLSGLLAMAARSGKRLLSLRRPADIG